ncbi:Sodium/potassium-transporting ATPase subunit beta-2 [Astathelohania contejeani]|uniref:Sodium/potassium-transporting ATPase subunit beta-2 n=1 Tax=Astathelohania contejeani TaxID=164912 RepID=A0ABQ7HWT9_9MICR|nr:Sodium/potassium-transporting ATPase subunit beta-2 [Thelohania contejeani]
MSLSAPIYIIILILFLSLGIITYCYSISLSKSSIPLSNKSGLYVILPDDHLIFNSRDRLTYNPIKLMYQKTIQKYTDNYQNNLSNFTENLFNSDMLERCDDNTSVEYDQFCGFNPDSDLLNDYKLNGYYLNTMTPIILLSFRNLPNFIPQVYENISDLPMSNDHDVVALREHMQDIYDKNNNKLPQCVWVSCTQIYPDRPSNNILEGFPKYYFPSKEHITAYLPPLLPLRIKLSRGLNYIKCKMWAKNINHSTDTFAFVTFSINYKTDYEIIS